MPGTIQGKTFENGSNKTFEAKTFDNKLANKTVDNTKTMDI